MVDFSIGVWTTEELYDRWKGYYGEDQAATRIAEYLRKNIEDEMGYDIRVYSQDDHPDPPKENLAPDRWEGYYEYPCGAFDVFYANGREWLEDWHSCTSQPQYDINLFATDSEGTYGNIAGTDDSYFMCAAEARYIGELKGEPWDAKGSDKKYSQMYATVLHEVGHAITREPNKEGCVDDGGWNDEYIAYTEFDYDQYVHYTTPMVTWRDTNECCASDMEFIDSYDDEKCFKRPYSSCLENYVRPM